MKKKILIIVVLVIGLFYTKEFATDLYWYYKMLSEVPLSATLNVGPMSATIDNDTPWEGIAKLVVSILSTYLGVRLIHKYIK